MTKIAACREDIRAKKEDSFRRESRNNVGNDRVVGLPAHQAQDERRYRTHME